MAIVYNMVAYRSKVKIYSIPETMAITILGKTTTVVMVPVRILLMKFTCVTMQSLII